MLKTTTTPQPTLTGVSLYTVREEMLLATGALRVGEDGTLISTRHEGAWEEFIESNCWQSQEVEALRELEEALEAHLSDEACDTFGEDAEDDGYMLLHEALARVSEDADQARAVREFATTEPVRLFFQSIFGTTRQLIEAWHVSDEYDLHGLADEDFVDFTLAVANRLDRLPFQVMFFADAQPASPTFCNQ